jgi:hypothetical protein
MGAAGSKPPHPGPTTRGRRRDDHLVGHNSAVRAFDDELPVLIPRQGKNIDPESDR